MVQMTQFVWLAIQANILPLRVRKHCKWLTDITYIPTANKKSSGLTIVTTLFTKLIMLGQTKMNLSLHLTVSTDHVSYCNLKVYFDVVTLILI